MANDAQNNAVAIPKSKTAANSGEERCWDMTEKKRKSERETEKKVT